MYTELNYCKVVRTALYGFARQYRKAESYKVTNMTSEAHAKKTRGA